MLPTTVELGQIRQNRSFIGLLPINVGVDGGKYANLSGGLRVLSSTDAMCGVKKNLNTWKRETEEMGKIKGERGKLHGK
jgi:hypothetical protein